MSASLENFIILSKAKFRVQDPDTYNDAYQHLDEASALLKDSCAESNVTVAKERTLDLWRCLSGACWNLGSSLCHACRWDHAVPYISKSVDIDQDLLSTAWDSPDNMNDNWSTFFEQMPKRAMLLAFCFLKINNRQVRNRRWNEKCSDNLLS